MTSAPTSFGETGQRFPLRTRPSSMGPALLQPSSMARLTAPWLWCMTATALSTSGANNACSASHVCTTLPSDPIIQPAAGLRLEKEVISSAAACCRNLVDDAVTEDWPLSCGCNRSRREDLSAADRSAQVPLRRAQEWAGGCMERSATGTRRAPDDCCGQCRLKLAANQARRRVPVALRSMLTPLPILGRV